MIWYSEPLDKVCQELETDPKSGLTEETLQHRREQYGANKLGEKPPRSFILRFFDQMKDVMVIILIIAAPGIPWTECIPCADRRRTGLD